VGWPNLLLRQILLLQQQQDPDLALRLACQKSTPALVQVQPATLLLLPLQLHLRLQVQQLPLLLPLQVQVALLLLLHQLERCQVLWKLKQHLAFRQELLHPHLVVRW
jgi:hypothetical protein